MAYGKIKADAIIRDNGGTDEEITMATIVTLDSGKASLTGATFTGDVLLDNEQELRLGEADANGTNHIALKAPATLDQTSTWTMPADVPAAGQVLKVTSVANTNDPTLEWADDVGASVSANNTWTAAQRGEVTTVTQSSGDLAIDFDASNNFYVLPTANITSITYTNLDAAHIGQSGSIFFQQPDSGNHTIGGWASTSRWAGGTGGSNNQPTFTATANTTDRVDYVIASTGNTTTDADVVVQLVHTANYAE